MFLGLQTVFTPRLECYELFLLHSGYKIKCLGEALTLSSSLVPSPSQTHSPLFSFLSTTVCHLASGRTLPITSDSAWLISTRQVAGSKAFCSGKYISTLSQDNYRYPSDEFQLRLTLSPLPLCHNCLLTSRSLPVVCKLPGSQTMCYCFCPDISSGLP